MSASMKLKTTLLLWPTQWVCRKPKFLTTLSWRQVTFLGQTTQPSMEKKLLREKLCTLMSKMIPATKSSYSFSFADGKLYKDKRVLCIGGSYSAEDIALQEWFKNFLRTTVISRLLETLKVLEIWLENRWHNPSITCNEGLQMARGGHWKANPDANWRLNGDLQRWFFTRLWCDHKMHWIPPFLSLHEVSFWF